MFAEDGREEKVHFVVRAVAENGKLDRELRQTRMNT